MFQGRRSSGIADGGSKWVEGKETHKNKKCYQLKYYLAVVADRRLVYKSTSLNWFNY